MSVYSIIAKVNPEIAILRLLKDNPDGLNTLAIKKEVCIGMRSIRTILDKLLSKTKIKMMEVGSSKVYYLG